MYHPENSSTSEYYKIGYLLYKPEKKMLNDNPKIIQNNTVKYQKKCEDS